MVSVNLDSRVAYSTLVCAREGLFRGGDLTMRARKSAKLGAKTAPSVRHAQAYAHIRNRIMEGKLLPDEPLSEYQLAEQLKLSRTPVREALKRLEHEGLVRFIFNRGAFVAGLSVHDIVEIYQ